jgi:hypothetical protein
LSPSKYSPSECNSNLSILCSVDRASQYNSSKWPTWRTILFSICLFRFSICFEQPRAHHQENQLYHYNIWHVSLCVGDHLVCGSGKNFPTCTGHLQELQEVISVFLPFSQAPLTLFLGGYSIPSKTFVQNVQIPQIS